MIASPEKTAKKPPRAGKNGVVPPVETQFKPGNPGGPGRPKGESLTTKLQRVLDEPDEENGTKADKLIKAAVDAAGDGDVRYFREIFERIDGKVPDRVAGHDGKEIVVKVIRGASMDDI